MEPSNAYPPRPVNVPKRSTRGPVGDTRDDDVPDSDVSANPPTATTASNRPPVGQSPTASSATGGGTAPFSYTTTDQQARFGLVGAASGGKTTFLSALSYAVERRAERERKRKGLEPWRMTASNDVSRDFADLGRETLRNRTFPEATVAEMDLSWHVAGTETTRTREFLPWKRTWVTREIDFCLDVEDIPGGAFRLDKSGVPMRPEALRRLVETDALVILFDPILELDAKDPLTNHDYMDKLINRLLTVADRTGQLIGGQLPQHVALCITKFDEPSIFQPAYEAGFVSIRDDGSPRIPDDRAEEFFGWMDRRIRDGVGRESASDVQSLLHTRFRSITYYVVSSIGFFRGLDGELNLADTTNVTPVGRSRMIRGAVRPVNVLEPLIDLERRVRSVA